VPRKKVVGVSKMSRLLKCFMRRLQIQERLTKQIADEMTKYLNPLGVGVRIVAVHSCMSCRGVMEPEADMVTTALTGVFRQHKVKSEFLEACQ
jgi:GTP cyclohydrolase I